MGHREYGMTVYKLQIVNEKLVVVHTAYSECVRV